MKVILLVLWVLIAAISFGLYAQEQEFELNVKCLQPLERLEIKESYFYEGEKSPFWEYHMSVDVLDNERLISKITKLYARSEDGKKVFDLKNKEFYAQINKYQDLENFDENNFTKFDRDDIISIQCIYVIKSGLLGLYSYETILPRGKVKVGSSYQVDRDKYDKLTGLAFKIAGSDVSYSVDGLSFKVESYQNGIARLSFKSSFSLQFKETPDVIDKTEKEGFVEVDVKKGKIMKYEYNAKANRIDTQGKVIPILNARAICTITYSPLSSSIPDRIDINLRPKENKMFFNKTRVKINHRYQAPLTPISSIEFNGDLKLSQETEILSVKPYKAKIHYINPSFKYTIKAETGTGKVEQSGDLGEFFGGVSIECEEQQTWQFKVNRDKEWQEHEKLFLDNVLPFLESTFQSQQQIYQALQKSGVSKGEKWDIPLSIYQQALESRKMKISEESEEVLTYKVDKAEGRVEASFTDYKAPGIAILSVKGKPTFHGKVILSEDKEQRSDAKFVLTTEINLTIEIDVNEGVVNRGFGNLKYNLECEGLFEIKGKEFIVKSQSTSDVEIYTEY